MLRTWILKAPLVLLQRMKRELWFRLSEIVSRHLDLDFVPGWEVHHGKQRRRMFERRACTYAIMKVMAWSLLDSGLILKTKSFHRDSRY